MLQMEILEILKNNGICIPPEAIQAVASKYDIIDIQD